jgi:oligopeptidase B
MKPVTTLVVSLLLSHAVLAADAAPKPPVAKKVPVSVTLHGDTRVDDYAWLRDKKNPDVIAYLQAENAYTDAMTSRLEPLRKRLYDEVLARVRQSDVNVPYRRGVWFYYSRTEEGKQYPIIARKKTLDAPEQILLDVNELAKGQTYMSVNALEPSDDGNLLAYSIDRTGYRQYELHVKDLRTGETLPDTAARTGSVVWAADNRTLFYSTENDAKRQSKVFRHTLGSKDDALLYDETDELFDVGIDRSRDGEWMFLTTESKVSSEVRAFRADTPDATPRVIVPRRADHKYYLEHRGDRFYIHTNDRGINYRVVSAPVDDPSEKNWIDVIAYRKPVRIETIDVFANYVVAREREGGLQQFEIVDLRDGKTHRVAFPEPAYSTLGAANYVFDTNVFRYAYESLVTPPSVFDYDMTTRKQTLLKRQEVLGGYDPAQYVSERIFATAADGVKVPIALVYKKGVDPHGKNPTLLYAYGSYGRAMPDAFSITRLSLLDRGVVYAIAHIRGGGELGKEWHEAGRMMTKKNTFTDFIAAAEHLIREKYTAKEKLVIQGGSAGGLLMGAVTNMRPDLFKAVLAQVPFVDVMNTMLDPTLPLTTQEYIEWGNPNEKAAYFYMKSYDPYSNIAKKKYPSMLVKTSLNDSQVGFWEGTKYVAKLRTMKTDANPLLLRVNMGAGHGGASGRYDAYREVAFDYAWVLSQMGITK